MREKFFDLGDLLGYYRFMKFDMRKQETLLPGLDHDQGKTGNAPAVRSAMEDRLCFIGDVEKFADHYLDVQANGIVKLSRWLSREIFEMAFFELKREDEIADAFAIGRVRVVMAIPKSLRYRENIAKIIKDMVRKMNRYYRDRGLFLECPGGSGAVSG